MIDISPNSLKLLFDNFVFTVEIELRKDVLIIWLSTGLDHN